MTDWRFSPKQERAICRSTARINLFDGPVRSGKTTSQIVRWIEFAIDAPGDRLLMTGKTRDTIRRNVLEDMFDIIGRKNYRYNQSDGEIRALGKTIYVIGANDERSESRVRGLTTGGWLADEVTLHPESFVKMALSRLSLEGSKAFWTCNPDSPFHFIHEGYAANETLIKKGMVRRFQFELDDNHSLGNEYKDYLKSIYSGLWYRRYILGEWCMAEGVVYDMFDAERHVVTDKDLPAKFDRFYVGVDHGTSNPCVFLLIGQKGRKLYVLREYYWDARKEGRQKPDDEYAKNLREFIGNTRVLRIEVDPSAASLIAACRKFGLPVRAAKNDVLPGISSVANALSNNLLYIHERCTNVKKEFASYAWDPKAQARGEDKPLKTADHAMDPLRYVVFRVHGRPDLRPVAKPAGM